MSNVHRQISRRQFSDLRSAKSHPVLGYPELLPYDTVVVKRAVEDRRYLDAVEALRAARNRLRLSQTELARKLGKRQQFVSKYQSGERRLDVIEFLDAANALGMPVGSLLRHLGDPMSEG
jgi:hypothetical protein